ncbi:MAG: hypothetical protein FWG19_00715 [Methanomassiliicoccaceae archaeon]|nr:hypothetical protein [Methanomassiliicoccaceae archaeon]
MAPAEKKDNVPANSSDYDPPGGEHLVLMSMKNRHHLEESVAENKELLRLLSE